MRLSSIWFGIAALYACAWLVLFLPNPIPIELIFAVDLARGFLFSFFGLVFAGGCRWVLERRSQSTGIRIFSYASFVCYFGLIAVYAWFIISQPCSRMSAWTRGRCPYDEDKYFALGSTISNAFVLFGIVFYVVTFIALLYGMLESKKTRPLIAAVSLSFVLFLWLFFVLHNM
jgi:hypothetical protein